MLQEITSVTRRRFLKKTTHTDSAERGTKNKTFATKKVTLGKAQHKKFDKL